MRESRHGREAAGLSRGVGRGGFELGRLAGLFPTVRVRGQHGTARGGHV